MRVPARLGRGRQYLRSLLAFETCSCDDCTDGVVKAEVLGFHAHCDGGINQSASSVLLGEHRLRSTGTFVQAVSLQ